MSDIRKYVQLLESSYNQVNVEQSYDECYLFSYDAEKLYESSGISLDVLMENRINWLRDNIMHKLEPLADKEGKTTEELFNWIIDRDPSTKKQYSQWLMKILVGKNAQSSLGDLEEAKQTLTKYEELKKSKALKPEHKDLNQFKSIDELSNAISDTEQSITSEYNAIEQRARDESEIIHEDNVWIVVIPKTEYAAGYWGRNSLWCTAAGFEGGRQEERSKNMFDTYSEISNIFTIMNKKKPSDIYQLHLATKQFMDSENKSIDDEGERKRIVDHFPKLKVALYKDMANSNDMGILFENYKMLFGDLLGHEVGEFGNNLPADAKRVYTYAKDIIKGRFKKGEDVIATSHWYSFQYAKDIIKGRFKKGEDAIATDSHSSYSYATTVIKKRFIEGEPAMANSSDILCHRYLNNILDGIIGDVQYPPIDETIQNKAIEYDTNIITKIDNPSESLLWSALNKEISIMPKVINHENFTHDMYRAAVRVSPRLIRYGEPDNELIAIAATREPKILKYFDEIDEEVMEYLAKYVKDSIKYINDPPEYIIELHRKYWVD